MSYSLCTYSCVYFHITISVTFFFFFFFNDTATTEIYTLSLHDALPILIALAWRFATSRRDGSTSIACIDAEASIDRKSTRLNSSHSQISYAVFCLKKKKKKKINNIQTRN